VFEFDEKISFDANNEIRSVLEAPIISPNFVHVNDLITFDEVTITENYLPIKLELEFVKSLIIFP